MKGGLRSVCAQALVLPAGPACRILKSVYGSLSRMCGGLWLEQWPLFQFFPEIWQHLPAAKNSEVVGPIMKTVRRDEFLPTIELKTQTHFVWQVDLQCTCSPHM